MNRSGGSILTGGGPGIPIGGNYPPDGGGGISPEGGGGGGAGTEPFGIKGGWLNVGGGGM